MDRLKELKEARAAAQEVISRIDNGISSLNSASSWGIFDLLGGGFFSSLIKRDKIQDANYDIEAISGALNKLNKELEDVNMHLPGQISNTMSDNVFDVWFDNIFTDIRVQGEIKNSLNELKDFRNQIIKLMENLDDEINKIR